MIIPCCDNSSSCNSITWFYPSLPNGYDDAGYYFQLVVLGVNIPVQFNLLSGSLPDGLTLSESGVITGEISDGAIGDYNFVVSVYDAHGCYSTKDYSIEILSNPGCVTVDLSTIIVSSSHFRVTQCWTN